MTQLIITILFILSFQIISIIFNLPLCVYHSIRYYLKYKYFEENKRPNVEFKVLEQASDWWTGNVMLRINIYDRIFFFLSVMIRQLSWIQTSLVAFHGEYIFILLIRVGYHIFEFFRFFLICFLSSLRISLCKNFPSCRPSNFP